MIIVVDSSDLTVAVIICVAPIIAAVGNVIAPCRIDIACRVDHVDVQRTDIVVVLRFDPEFDLTAGTGARENGGVLVEGAGRRRVILVRHDIIRLIGQIAQTAGRGQHADLEEILAGILDGVKRDLRRGDARQDVGHGPDVIVVIIVVRLIGIDSVAVLGGALQHAVGELDLIPADGSARISGRDGKTRRRVDLEEGIGRGSDSGSVALGVDRISGDLNDVAVLERGISPVVGIIIRFRGVVIRAADPDGGADGGCPVGRVRAQFKAAVIAVVVGITPEPVTAVDTVFDHDLAEQLIVCRGDRDDRGVIRVGAGGVNDLSQFRRTGVIEQLDGCGSERIQPHIISA